MGVKITELNEAMTAQNTDLMPIVQNGETKKIEIQTLMSNLQTQITSLQNQVYNVNVITGGGSDSVTASSTGEVTIPITSATSQVGSAFTISSNKIYVGAGINNVLLSAQVYCNLVANRGAPFNFTIKKNGVAIAAQVNGGYASTTLRNACLSIPSKLVPVTQGDYFEYTVYVYSGDVIRADSINNTYITIQAVN